jgi:serine protease Do
LALFLGLQKVTANQAAETLADLLATLRGSVVKVNRHASRGTGFIVSPDGVVATAVFVVDSGEDVSVEFANGEIHPARPIAATDADRSVALLRIELERLPALAVADRPAAVGEKVVTLGFGGSGGEGVAAGVVTELTAPGSGAYGEVHALIKTEPGYAGAPLVRRDGTVVAMHAGARSNPDGTKTAFAIPAAAVADALAKLPPAH